MKKVKLTKKSWHRWVYNHIYDRYDQYTNLCPYFWRVVGGLFFMIIGTPIFFLLGIYKIAIERRWPHYMEDFGLAMVVNIMSVLTILMYWMWFVPWRRDAHGNISGIIVFGFVGWIIYLTIAGVYIGQKVIEGRKKAANLIVMERYRLTGKWDESEKPEKRKRTWFLIEFIKATYKKHCPEVEWE